MSDDYIKTVVIDTPPRLEDMDAGEKPYANHMDDRSDDDFAGTTVPRSWLT